MQGVRSVISTLTSDGQEVMGPGVLVWHYPDNSIVNNSLLTVESNHFCVLKSRGAILNVYDTGQYPVTTPDRPILGSFTQAFFGGQSPWQYEALYINTISMGFATLIIPLAGVISDRIGRKPLMIGTALATVLFAHPLFRMLLNPSFASMLTGQLGLATLFAFYLGAAPAAGAESFHARVRCTGTAVSHNVTMAVLGGTAPMLVTWFIAWTGDTMSPAHYLTAAALVSALVAFGIRETAHHRDLSKRCYGAGEGDNTVVRRPENSRQHEKNHKHKAFPAAHFQQHPKGAVCHLALHRDLECGDIAEPTLIRWLRSPV